jgi:hypothetical protein
LTEDKHDFFASKRVGAVFSVANVVFVREWRLCELFWAGLPNAVDRLAFIVLHVLNVCHYFQRSHRS